ncbi:hypothetical protein J7T55_006338 [Diaporthe amygdali]|uniref:uncharacterized protein n=1 Tax=Phomopsis amygdali TaxID=1214568 RepID=UPI0022FDDC0D|nr:uncharacterized protein J7T55_006338 [Diaporthe amygdali]KAJ0124995.1 hypothetical protein J7T55_006338 [Diaporthe amygdali]
MSFYADIFYLAHLWEIARPRGEDCLQAAEQHIASPKETTEKGHTRDLGKLFRHAAAKTFRYAQRDSYRRHKDNTYIVLNDLGEGDDEDSDGEWARNEVDPDFVASTSFRRSLSQRASRIMGRRRL